MRRAWLVLAALAACAHAKETQSPAKTGEAAPRGTGAPSGMPESRLERQPKAPGQPLVASSPAGLLEREAPREIQAALEEHGIAVKRTGLYDEQTAAALRHFQRREHLAAHGMPDQLTLTRLGLDPTKIYRANPEGDKAKTERRAAEPMHPSGSG